MSTVRRRSLRLKDYDYASPGHYFVTVCCDRRRPLLTDARNRQIISRTWWQLRNHFRHVDLDAFVVMPNHIHGVVTLRESVGADCLTDSRSSSDRDEQSASPRGSALRDGLPAVLRQFKRVSTFRINGRLGSRGVKFWQRGYWEHIVRSERSLERIRRYIAENPLNWEWDPENPDRSASRGEDLWDELLAAGHLRLVGD